MPQLQQQQVPITHAAGPGAGGNGQHDEGGVVITGAANGTTGFGGFSFVAAATTTRSDLNFDASCAGLV